MQQLINVWVTLNGRRRMIVVLATVAMFAAVMTMSKMASNPSLTLLYAGLESGAAGDIVRTLEQRGIAYEVRGGSIYAESGRRDELRMTLASEGLPENGGKGYELLDSLSGFGTTSQMFDAAYWRAKEGELARTIMANPHIGAARVHIANTGSNPFQRETKPTASVSVTAASGAISADHAKALKYLVASAVAGLAPQDVAVIDSSGSMIGSSDETVPNVAGFDRSNILRERVKRLLEARVGFGNAVVEVSVDTVTESESIREHTFDPGTRVAISTDTEESSNNSSDSGGGDVTVASNIPDGDASSSDSSSTNTNTTRERINFEVSETNREVLRVPGAIKRIAVAVLVNDPVPSDENGASVVTPRSAEELNDLKDLVAAAVGFDEGRGDVITLKSMSFEPLTPAGTEGAPSFLAALNLDIMSIVQVAVLGVVAMILGLFVVRPILMQPARTLPAELPRPDRNNIGGAQTDSAPTPLVGEIESGDFNMENLPVVSGMDGKTIPTLEGDNLAANSDDPVDRLRNLIGERQEETVEILRGWLEDEEETA